MVDNVHVTTAFLVHVFGMVAAKEAVVNVQDASKSESAGSAETTDVDIYPSNDGELPEALGVEEVVPSDDSNVLESLRDLFAEPSEAAEPARNTMDSDHSNPCRHLACSH